MKITFVCRMIDWILAKQYCNPNYIALHVLWFWFTPPLAFYAYAMEEPKALDYANYCFGAGLLLIVSIATYGALMKQDWVTKQATSDGVIKQIKYLRARDRFIVIRFLMEKLPDDAVIEHMNFKFLRSEIHQQLELAFEAAKAAKEREAIRTEKLISSLNK